MEAVCITYPFVTSVVDKLMARVEREGQVRSVTYILQQEKFHTGSIMKLSSLVTRVYSNYLQCSTLC
jgi:hypothetical protein